MMYPVLPQTDRAIWALRKAGYKRSSFRVRTPMNKNGEYGETTITVYAPLSEQVERAEKVATRLHVTKYIDAGSGEVIHLSYSNSQPAGITTQAVSP